jgi:hypothetical protein
VGLIVCKLSRRSGALIYASPRIFERMNRLFFVFPVASAIWAATGLPARAAQERVFFTPSATDPGITQFNNPHYAVVDPANTNQGRLLLFLPGTGGTPFNYRVFPQNAASLGFHTLGLMYPNGDAINVLCAQNAPLDPDAAGNARWEVIDGTDRVSFLNVDRTNGIESRLLKALQYLQAQYPTRGWGQFYSGDTVLWDKLIVAGTRRARAWPGCWPRRAAWIAV